MNANQEVFATVPRKDYLSLFNKSGTAPDYKKVIKFFDFKNDDTAAAANVPLQSVRFDEKMPKNLADRILEWAAALSLVAQYFEGDAKKTALWFRIPNPMLGNISPRDMIRFGKFKRLLQFIQTALDKNKA